MTAGVEHLVFGSHVLYQRSGLCGLVVRQVDCFFNGSGHRKEVIHPGGFEELKNTGRHTCGDEVDPFALAADEVPDDEAETAGIEVGNFCQIEDIDGWMPRWVGFEEVFKRGRRERGVHIPRCEGAGKAEDD